MERFAHRALPGTRPMDIRLAAVAAAIQIGGTLGASGHRQAQGDHGCWWSSSCHAATQLDVLGVVLLAIGPLALLVRPRHPRGALAVIFAAALLYVTLGYLQGPNYFSLVVAVVLTVRAGDRTAARVAVIAGWVLFLWLPAALGVTGAPTVLAALSIAAWLVVLLAAAEALRGRQERAAEARHARQEEARRKADEERLRIARELHDVLAHHISLINVQSGVALHLMDDQPEQARIALEAINEASADALREVRSTLEILRGGKEAPPRAPAAGLARLDELVSRASAAGVGVSLEVQGDPRPLPASVDLAAFRIVQESLTNVVRHAEAGTAKVEVTYRSRDLTLQIDDDGRAPPARAGGGSGISGMRERATALGGELEAGPQPAGGFRVRARLPLGSQA
ncbi:MAG TPA: sensor histidine kinase [Solirubrobacteraceae bacterium]|nr:sensor histidine kinase [Solirubrobacteraceae bacterium]